MQQYVFVSDLWHVGGFHRGSSANKNDHHDITELVVQVAKAIIPTLRVKHE